MKIKLHQLAIATVAVATAGIIAVHNAPQGRSGPTELYPVNTPGVTNAAVNQSNIQQTICVSGYTATIRPPASYTSALKAKQLPQGSDPTQFEEDHFISLELGGNPTDANNLWPESYTTQVNGVTIGAKQKDLTENFIKKEICNNTLTLLEGQQEITSDWYKVYLQMTGNTNLGGANEPSTSDD